MEVLHHCRPSTARWHENKRELGVSASALKIRQTFEMPIVHCWPAFPPGRDGPLARTSLFRLELACPGWLKSPVSHGLRCLTVAGRPDLDWGAYPNSLRRTVGGCKMHCFAQPCCSYGYPLASEEKQFRNSYNAVRFAEGWRILEATVHPSVRRESDVRF